MRRNSLKLAGLAAFFAFATTSFAGIVIASGAGPLPGSAQDLTGLFPTEIDGTLSGSNMNDVSMFKFKIDYANQFSAKTVSVISGIPDTELFLFDSAGNPIYMNDDISGANTLSCLPSVVSNPCPTAAGGLGPATTGIYYLAITRSLQLPLDGSSLDIFSYQVSGFDSTAIYGKNPGTGPIASWDGGAFGSPNFDQVKYQINLTGTVPEPGSALLVAALAGAWILRRKLRA